MTIKGELILRRTLTVVLYAAMERFISDDVTPELEKSGVKADKNTLLKKSEEMIERAVTKALKELEKNKFNSIDELENDPGLVESLMNKIQEDLINDAKSLQNH